MSSHNDLFSINNCLNKTVSIWVLRTCPCQIQQGVSKPSGIGPITYRSKPPFERRSAIKALVSSECLCPSIPRVGFLILPASELRYLACPSSTFCRYSGSCQFNVVLVAIMLRRSLSRTFPVFPFPILLLDRKSTRLNSS